MPVTQAITGTTPYLQIVVAGRIDTLDELSAYGDQVIANARRYGKRCILLDERKLRTDLDLVDIINFVEGLSTQEIQSLRLRVAVLGSKTRRKDLSQDFEVFLQSKHFRYRIFETAEDALPWLIQGDCNPGGGPDLEPTPDKTDSTT